MTQPGALGGKLTATQFRMLRRVTEGLSTSTLRRERTDSIATQVRTLRILCQLDLVVETQGEDDVRFEITAAGRRLLEPGAR